MVRMQPAQPYVAGRNSRVAVALPLMLAVLAAYFFAVRVWHGYRYLAFVDESEHLLGGKMLNEGAILYRSFVTQHGPVTFMLTQAYGAIFGWRHANGARLMSAALALGAGWCVATTPALPGRIARLWAAALFLGLIASVWLLQGLYLVNYHAIAGFLLVAALALCVVPAWHGVRVHRARAFAAGACGILVIATAYSFGPAIVLLGASALWAMRPERLARWALVAGGAAAGLCVLAWLLIFGDMIGFLAFHFAENQFVVAHFIPFTFAHFLRSLVPSLRPADLVQTLAVLCCMVSFCLFFIMDLTRPRQHLVGPILLGFLGMLAQNARGGPGFQNGSFLIGGIGLFSVALPAALLRFTPAPGPTGIVAGTLLIGLCVAGAELAGRGAVNSPFGMTRAQMVHAPHEDVGYSKAPGFDRIRALVPPNEPILVVPYAPDIYLAADRKPMDRYFYYLPWDAEYAKAPWFGETHDLCVDLAKAPPLLIHFDHWKVWDRYEMRDYMPCFIAFLGAHYRRQTDFPNLYLRVDPVNDKAIQP
jgi:hypothetical protein